MKKRIAVIGPIPKDTIITHRDEVIEKYGCITHPVIALSKISDGDLEIVPVTHVRKADKAPILQVFEPYAHINCDYISDEADQGDVIQLRFVDQNNRLEKQTAFMNPIVPADLEGLMDCAAFVFLPITDFEITLDTLRHIKANSAGIIVFDAHGPTNTLTKTGDRLLQYWIDRDVWLPYIDVLKMNFEESTCCWFERGEVADFGHDRSHLPKLAAHALDLGVKSVIITVDSSGCLVYTRAMDGSLKEELVPSVKVETVIDTTGCGDSFGGGLAYGLVQLPDNFINAAHYANTFGALRTQGKTFEVFKNRAETEAIIQKTYL
jgi:adenosine kinase